MKAAELRVLTAEQLEERLQELHGEWRDLRFQEAVGNLTATGRTRQIRKEIARILTIITENERAQPAAAR
jgi:large subunit ribosomal protein L29